MPNAGKSRRIWLGVFLVVVLWFCWVFLNYFYLWKRVLQWPSSLLLCFFFTFHLAFPSPSNLSFHLVTESLYRLLNFFHSVILGDDGNDFHWVFYLTRSEPASYSSPSPPCGSPASQMHQHLLGGQPYLTRKKEVVVVVLNHSKIQKLLLISTTAELTHTSSSCAHRTLRKSLVSLWPLLYSSGISELVFNKAATNVEENRLIDNSAVQLPHKSAPSTALHPPATILTHQRCAHSRILAQPQAALSTPENHRQKKLALPCNSLLTKKFIKPSMWSGFLTVICTESWGNLRRRAQSWRTEEQPHEI